ncbi:MAG: TetR/AcrR family transcriptional regulator [Cypionkella sp.]
MNTAAQHASPELWLNAAYALLIEGGVEAVKVMTLARRAGLTRTGFYWHFRDLNALLDALVERWEQTNTGNLVARANAPASSITEAMLNVFDCWHDATMFDAPLDLAVRNWARIDRDVQTRLDQADARRTNALVDMFLRFDYPPEAALIRSLTVLYTQIGYISMRVAETQEQRLVRVPQYVEVFTGVKPSLADMECFRIRHE